MLKDRLQDFDFTVRLFKGGLFKEFISYNQLFKGVYEDLEFFEWCPLNFKTVHDYIIYLETNIDNYKPHQGENDLNLDIIQFMNYRMQ